MINIVILVWHGEKDRFRSVDGFTPKLDPEVSEVAGEFVYCCVADDTGPFSYAGFAPIVKLARCLSKTCSVN